MKPRDENDRAQAGELPADPAAGLRPAPLPRRASSPTPPPAAPTDDLDDAGPPTTPSNRAPASGVVPGGELGAEGEVEPDDGLQGSWRWLRDCTWGETPPPARRWLLMRPADITEDSHEQRGFLPLGKVGMIAAAGGAGKTMLAVQLAVSVITGRPWLGHFGVPVGSRGPVLLALAEEDEEEVQRRLWSVRRGLSLNDKEWAEVQRSLLPLALAGKTVNLVRTDRKTGETSETDFLATLRNRLESAGVDWRLVILDPLSRWAGTETETDNAAATRFVAAVESLVTVRGKPTVLLTHHTNKAARAGDGAGDATDARGASGLTDGVRWVASLKLPRLDDKDRDKKKPPPKPRLALVKSNYSPPALPRVLERGPDGVLSVLDETKAKASEPPPSDETDDDELPEGWGKLCAGNFPHRNRPINGSGR